MDERLISVETLERWHRVLNEFYTHQSNWEAFDGVIAEIEEAIEGKANTE